MKKIQTEIDEIIDEIVSSYNERFGRMWNKMSKPHQVKWRPIHILECDDNDELEMFAQRYYLAPNGSILQVENNDWYNATLKIPYWNKSCKSFKYNLYCSDGKHRCQTIHNLLREIWGDEIANKYKEHEDMIQSALDEVLNTL